MNKFLHSNSQKRPCQPELSFQLGQASAFAIPHPTKIHYRHPVGTYTKIERKQKLNMFGMHQSITYQSYLTSQLQILKNKLEDSTLKQINKFN